jgi:hypothetical protein
MAHDVFVSYANKDKPVADAVVAGLEKAGVRCWYAPRDIDPGASWGEAINEAIEGSRFMVIVLSGNANRSNHVVREVERAVANNVIIIPFRIEDITPTGAMAYFLSTEHWLDALSPPLKKHVDELVSTIQRFIDGKEAPPKPAPELKSKVPLWAIITPAALLIAVIVLGLIFIPRWLGSIGQEPPPLAEVGETGQAAAQDLTPSETPAPTETPSPTPVPSFTLLGSWLTSREVHNVTLDGEIAYLANGEDGLVILDLSDPANPVELGGSELENVQNVQVLGSMAYAVEQGMLKDNYAEEDRFVVLDISDPANTQVLGSFTPEGPHLHRSLNNFAVEGDLVYLVTSDRLVIVDISDLETPTTLGEFTFNSNISSPGMCVEGEIVYIQANELTVVDASNPANPVPIGGFDAGWGSDVTVADGTAYLAGWSDGLTVLDVSDPSRPLKLGGFKELVGDYSKVPNGVDTRQIVLDVSVSGDRAYLTYNFGLDHGTWTEILESGVIALDISDLANPTRLAVYNHFDEVSEVTASGDLVLVTDKTRGLFILEAPE